MNRLLVAMMGALLPAWMGCANTESPETLGCASEDFDRSGCDLPAVSAVKAEGIWQAKVTLDGLDTPGAMRLLPEGPLLFNTPLKERPGEGGPFFLASEYTDSSVPLRLVASACQAPEATRVTGEFRRCANGAADMRGTFEAVRVQRVAGEQEASGVELVAEVPLPRGAEASDVFVSGGYAYVTAYAEGLFVFDVRNPSAPLKVAEVKPAKDVWRRAWVKGQTLYISSAAQGLLVYDVSNPALPERLSALPETPVEAWGLYEDQGLLYVMAPYPKAEVLLFDIRQYPTNPPVITRYFVKDSLINRGDLPVEGVVAGNRLYMGHWRYGFAVVDVSNPAKPVDLGRFHYDKATSRPVAVGSIEGRTIAFEASEGWDSRVRALNVTDPKNITQVGEFQTRPQSTVSAMTLVGTRLYVAYAQDGLRILDVSNPSTPKQQAYYNTWRESDPGRGRAFIDGLSAVKVPGDGYLYAAETSRGLLVLREQ